MKILLVCNYKPGRGGISGQVELLQKHLSAEGIQTEIFSTAGTVRERILLFFRLKKKACGFDMIHAHGCSGWGFLPIVISVLTGKRVVATYHGGGAESFFDRHTRLVRKCLTGTEANIVLSGFLAEVFEKHHLPCTVIPNIVELESSVYRVREVFRPRFISIRTLSPLYNIECIIKAFTIVKRRISDASLVIVGDGPNRKSLEKMVADMEIEGVSFTGRVKNDDIYHYLKDADIMLSASTVDNMPVSLLEAFNAGVLVISSDVGGVPYMVENGVNGLMFGNDKSEELAEKMVWAVSHQAESKQMVLSAKEDINKFLWPAVREKLLDIYHLIQEK